MNIDEAKTILRAHNRWRRGDDTQQHPTDIGTAIDTLCGDGWLPEPIGDATDLEMIERFLDIARNMRPVGQWPGERLCSAIERLRDLQGAATYLRRD